MATVEKRRDLAAGDGLREALLADLPVTDRRLEVAGIETALLEGGEGTPVVLLHGPGEFAATWLRVIPQLAATHRVVAPDLPGHGASGLPAGPLDAERALAWLGELIERTCDSPPALVGHLLGGSLAARFAADNGSRISRLVVVDGYGLAPLRPAPSFALGLIGFMARPTERSQGRLMRACMNDLQTLRERMDGRLEELEAYALDRARGPAMKKALRALMPQLGMRPIPEADLERITVQTTLIWGRHDLQVRLRVAEAASARFGWPLHVIEDAADDPAVEQPEAFLDALEAALAGFDEREQRRTA
jgi:pimeloyl-ACP methyl ester carboxylesterase